MVPKIFWSLKKRAHRLGQGRPRLANRLGCRWLLDPSDWLDMQLLIGRPYETEQLASLARLCRARQINHFIDCGANIGLYSVMLPRTVATIKRVDAFEPLSSVRWRLIANLGLNDMYGLVHVHPVALSDAAGSTRIHVDPTSTGVSAISPSGEEIEHRRFGRSEEIASVRFDDYLTDLHGPLAVKVDVEGHELQALQGMREALKDHVAVLQVETRERNRQHVGAFLCGLGFTENEAIGDDVYYVRAAGRR